MSIGNVPFFPPANPYTIPAAPFEGLIASVGQRVAWMRSHTCPCVFGGGGANGLLPLPGSAQKRCTTCFGVGTYWDPPGQPFRAYISFMHLSPSPDEPGTVMNPKFGPAQLAEPSLTIPYTNPNLKVDDQAQPTNAWNNSSTNDFFVAVDMIVRYTAVLQVGGIESLPYQQNLQIAPSGAVTIWDPTAAQIAQVPYEVSGPTVLISGYDDGTNYMVEFQAAAIYVAWRSAGGLPHVRPFDGGAINEPRRFRLQTLDYWTRQRGIQLKAAGSSSTGGVAFPYVLLSGQVTGS